MAASHVQVSAKVNSLEVAVGEVIHKKFYVIRWRGFH